MTDFEPSRRSCQPVAIISRGVDAAAVPAVQPPIFFPAGSEIYAQGEKCRHLYWIEFGAVRVFRLLPDGRRQILAFHLAGEEFGFEVEERHHFFAEAMRATGIRIVHPSADGIAAELLPIARQSLLRAQEQLLLLSHQNAVERVAAFLIEMSGRQGGLQQIELPMSRLDIADYLGLTIETVSRAFTRLRQNGTIRVSGLRNVEIVKLQALQTIAA